jgi:hypothetical protein
MRIVAGPRPDHGSTLAIATTPDAPIRPAPSCSRTSGGGFFLDNQTGLQPQTDHLFSQRVPTGAR